MDSYDISASALTAQRARLDIISSNLANINTTRRADGQVGPYLRKNVVFSELLDSSMNNTQGRAGFLPQAMTGNNINNGQPQLTAPGVQVATIAEDTNTPTRKVYDPGHPDADANGYVEMPNINPITEMVDMISATRAYEANITAMQSSKSMDKASLDI